MITIEKSAVVRQPDEYAPMITAEVRAALRTVHHNATPLYLEIQALPTGFAVTDEWLRARLGWTVTALRSAKEGLIKIGLYVAERVQIEAGHWIQVCRYVTNMITKPASPQVQPSAGSPTAGEAAPIPPSRERKREGFTRRRAAGKVHSPATCPREAAGKPCRQCGKVAAAERASEKPSAPTLPASHPAYRPVREVLAETAGRPAASNTQQCEHKRSRHACLACAKAAAAG